MSVDIRRRGPRSLAERGRVDIPQLFEAQAIGLRINVGEIFLFDQLFGLALPRPSREQEARAPNFGRVVIFGLPFLSTPLFFGDDLVIPSPS